jgi:hypothetical protein
VLNYSYFGLDDTLGRALYGTLIQSLVTPNQRDSGQGAHVDSQALRTMCYAGIASFLRSYFCFVFLPEDSLEL